MHAEPIAQSAVVLHCPYGEQTPLTQGIEGVPGHSLEVVHAFKLGMQ